MKFVYFAKNSKATRFFFNRHAQRVTNTARFCGLKEGAWMLEARCAKSLQVSGSVCEITLDSLPVRDCSCQGVAHNEWRVDQLATHTPVYFNQSIPHKNQKVRCLSPTRLKSIRSLISSARAKVTITIIIYTASVAYFSIAVYWAIDVACSEC